MRIKCRSCHRYSCVKPDCWRGRPGPLWCFSCARPLDTVSVSDWGGWVAGQIERKRALQAAGDLHTRKQSLRESDAAIDADGLAAELAACLLLCPGFVADWQRSVEQGGNNRGRDLLPAWTGGILSVEVEVKYTKYRDESHGYLLVRPPPRKGPHMCAEYVDECLYVLVQPDGSFYRLSGWVDRQCFLSRKVENPWGVSPGQIDCWGAHWSRLEPLDTFPEPAAINFAVLSTTVDQAPESAGRFWYGYSAADGFVVINWQDRRNGAERSPRYLHMLRWRDRAEVRVPFNRWCPPDYQDAFSYVATLPELEKNVLCHELAVIQFEVEGRSG